MCEKKSRFQIVICGLFNVLCQNPLFSLSTLILRLSLYLKWLRTPLPKTDWTFRCGEITGSNYRVFLGGDQLRIDITSPLNHYIDNLMERQ